MALSKLAQEKPAAPAGKQKLIEAALRLAARDGTALSSLGLRELAREAGLNHNTFYRHFADLEELANTMAVQVSDRIMAGLKEVRRNAATHADATVGSAKYFLDFVQENRDAFVVGLREIHSIESPMRRLMRQVLDDIAIESVEQITSMNLVPGVDAETLRQATSAIAYYMFFRALDFIEHPEQREQITDEIVNFSRAQFLGSMALRRAAPRPVTNT
jgi:TetR/AcrR family transcriptional regulator, fatty acid biosynthesis regulator